MDDLEEPKRKRGRPKKISAPPAALIEGELVVSPAPALIKPVKRKPRIFSDAVLSPERRGRFSEREQAFLAILLKTGSTALAAEEIGVSRVSAWRYTQRPHIKRYLDRLRMRAAKAADLTPDKIAAVIGDAVDGDPRITPMQLQAASIAAKILAPARGPSVVINQQTNYNGVSPFADLGQTAMLDEIKRNLLEMGAGPDSE